MKLKRKSGAKGSGETRGKKTDAPATPQGISAGANGIYRIGFTALLAAVVPILAAFAYLLLVREPQLKDDAIERVSTSYAVQQATNIDRLFVRLEDRLDSAARTNVALSAIASPSLENLAALEKNLLAFFPEAESLRIVPVGELGTAVFTSGERGLRNHIEVDLVRKSSEGKNVNPESYEVDGTWFTSMVRRAQHPDFPGRSAVLLLTINNGQLSSQLKSLNPDAGAFALQQTHVSSSGKENTDTIAKSGGKTDNSGWYADVPDTNWRVRFSPSDSLVTELSASPLPLYAVLGTALLAGLMAIGIFMTRFPRLLASEAEKIVAAANRRSQLEIALPELVPLAKQLRRATLRVLRQTQEGEQGGDAASADSEDTGTASAVQPARGDVAMTDPMFQSSSMLDEDDDELDLDLGALDDFAEPDAPATAGTGVDPVTEADGVPGHIFRAYDIRGNAKHELTDELVTRIGRAIGTMADEIGEQALIVGCDGRSSSPRIKSALVRALMESGRDIIDIGVVPTPLLYFATHHLNYRSGVMITGSHNPAEDNGLKIVLNQQTIAAGGIQTIREKAMAGEFVGGNGRLIRENVIPAYIDDVLQDIAIAVPLKIVIDAGNGATGEIAPELFRELGCEVVPLYCDINGAFPNRSPDTSNEANLADLTRAVKEENADFGVAFDGDGDRLAIVTSSGRIVRTDVLLMLYAEDVVSRNPGADVVFDVKCSRNLTNLITQHGGRPVLWKTGHAFMKEKMQETGALLGGEFSGHIFFGERWYGFDDGMYAAARLAEILSTQGDSLDDAIDRFPSTINTPEIIIPVADDYKFQLVDAIVKEADFTSGKVNTMDGIRVDFSEGWGLVRASNTGPALTARFEADTAEHLEVIQEEFRAQIALVDPDIELGF